MVDTHLCSSHYLWLFPPNLLVYDRAPPPQIRQLFCACAPAERSRPCATPSMARTRFQGQGALHCIPYSQSAANRGTSSGKGFSHLLSRAGFRRTICWSTVRLCDILCHWPCVFFCRRPCLCNPVQVSTSVSVSVIVAVADTDMLLLLPMLPTFVLSLLLLCLCLRLFSVCWSFFGYATGSGAHK